MRIGIDLMGSDRSPQVLFDAVIQAAKQFDQSHVFVVIADEGTIHSLLELQNKMASSSFSAKIEFFLAREMITMKDDPIRAVRKKKDSSMVQGMRLLKKKQIDGFISAGNTGALVAAATLTLPLIGPIRRPGLLATLPTESGHVAVIDVGGTAACKASHLLHFAELGGAFEKIFHGIAIPKIGLLNVGSESKKGTHEHRLAHEMLRSHFEKSNFQFVGNVESRDVFQDRVNVLVTDGFTGNILLKTAEGVAQFILDFLRKNGPSTSSNQVQHLLQQIQSHFSYSEFPGALLLGVEGIVMKCHGDASSKEMLSSIKAAISYVERGVVQKIKKEIQSLF